VSAVAAAPGSGVKLRARTAKVAMISDMVETFC
jgi:hypothetical protein